MEIENRCGNRKQVWKGVTGVEIENRCGKGEQVWK